MYVRGQAGEKKGKSGVQTENEMGTEKVEWKMSERKKISRLMLQNVLSSHIYYSKINLPVSVPLKMLMLQR